jgi:hypothetical protein
MRTELLCALALLGGAEVVFAQQMPAYPSYGYYPGYAQAYPVAPQAYGYAPYPQTWGAARPPMYYYPPNYYNRGYYYPVSYSRNSYAYYTPTYAAAMNSSVDQSGQEPVVKNVPPEAPPPAPVCHPVLDAVKEACCCPYEKKPEERFWVTGNYVMGWMKTEHASTPLVTTGAVQDPNGGALGAPTTSVLFGPDIKFKTFSGVRLEAGLFLDDADQWSVDGGLLYFFPKHVRYNAAADGFGNPLIGRPFFDTGVDTPASLAFGGDPTSQREAVFLDSFNGVALPAGTPGAGTAFTGALAVDAKSELYGFDFNARYHLYCMGRLHADFLAGFRFLRLEEYLNFTDFSTDVAGAPLTFLGAPIGPTDVLLDKEGFQTANQFYGLQVGAKARWDSEWWFVDLWGKLGLGATQQIVDITGTTVLFSAATGVQATSGALLAQPSNIGHYQRHVFGVVPEGGFTAGINVTNWLRVTAGYSFLYWNSVVRPGAQIDRYVNRGQIPADPFVNTLVGDARPVFRFNDESFWVHCLNLGLEFHY